MLIDKQTMPMVAMEFMNDVHAEDIDLINELYESILAYEKQPNEENKNTIDKNYQEWFEHTVAHFQREEVMMEEKNFPPYPFHKAEHDNALTLMDEVFREWSNANDIEILKNYFETTLPQWLSSHIQSMDTVTAMFFKSGLSPCSLG
ncbi:MAG: hemerythrin family protein [Sulfurimonas sp.]|jgi:hemerythrin